MERKKKDKNWRSNRSRRSDLKFNELARELQDLLDIPLQEYRTKSGDLYKDHTKAREIIRAIIQTMINGLKIGEKVNIPGFGTFKVVSLPAQKAVCGIVASDKDGNVLANSSEVIMRPPKKRVVFKPSEHLYATVNLVDSESLSFKQRRAMRT